jgi:hypothetical protein
MTYPKHKLAIIVGLAIVFAALACMSMPAAFAQSSQATIVGQVTVNGTPTNGVLVTCGPSSNTTFTYNGTPGYYIIGGLPYGTSMPFTASYQGYTYTDNVDPLSTGQQYYQIPTVNVNTPAASVTPTPLANATVTPAPNATVTPAPNATATPAPNATVTPAPNSTVTPAPNVSVTPAPLSETPTPVPPAPTMPPVTPMPLEVTATPIPVMATPTIEPTLMPTPEPTLMPTPTAEPLPTQTKSPGFEGLLALLCLPGAAYLALRKGR